MRSEASSRGSTTGDLTSDRRRRPDVVVFDVVETLASLDVVAERLATHGVAESLLSAWFSRLLRDGIALTAAGGFARFADVAASALRSETAGALSDAQISDVVAGFAELTGCVPIAARPVVGTVPGMAYPSDLTDEQWALLEPVFNAPGKRGRKHRDDLRTVVDAMLYIAQTGCQWRYLPESFGVWTRVWSQFRRWSRNGTWARALTVLHAAAREAEGRAEATPSMLVVDTHLARGGSNGGATFHDRGGAFGRTKGAKRVVAVDVTGLPVAGLVVPASMHENETTRVVLDHLAQQSVTDRLELVLVDRGVTARAADKLGRRHGVEVRRVGWDDKQPVFRPIRHAWRVEVAHGRLGRSRRLAKSFENTTASATGWLQVACIALTLRHLSQDGARPASLPRAA